MHALVVCEILNSFLVSDSILKCNTCYGEGNGHISIDMSNRNSESCSQGKPSAL